MEYVHADDVERASRGCDFFARLPRMEVACARTFANTASLVLARPPDEASDEELRCMALIYASIVGSAKGAVRRAIVSDTNRWIAEFTARRPQAVGQYVALAIVGSILDNVPDVQVSLANPWAVIATVRLLAKHPQLVTPAILDAAVPLATSVAIALPLLRAFPAIPFRNVALDQVKQLAGVVWPSVATSPSEFAAVTDFTSEEPDVVEPGFWLTANPEHAGSLLFAVLGDIAMWMPAHVRWRFVKFLLSVAPAPIAMEVISRVHPTKDMVKRIRRAVDDFDGRAAELAARIIAAEIPDVTRARLDVRSRMWVYSVLDRPMTGVELGDVAAAINGEPSVERLALYALLRAVPQLTLDERLGVHAWLTPMITTMVDPVSLYLAARLARSLDPDPVLEVILARAELPLTRRAAQVMGVTDAPGAGNPLRVQLEGLTSLSLNDQIQLLNRYCTTKRLPVDADLAAAIMAGSTPAGSFASTSLRTAVLRGLPPAAWAVPIATAALAHHHPSMSRAAYAILEGAWDRKVEADFGAAGRAAATDPEGLSFFLRWIDSSRAPEFIGQVGDLGFEVTAALGVYLIRDQPAADVQERLRDALRAAAEGSESTELAQRARQALSELSEVS